MEGVNPGNGKHVRDSTRGDWQVAEAGRLAQELALLDEVRTALSRELELPAIFRAMIHGVVTTFGYTHASLFLRDANDLVLQEQAGYTALPDRVPVTRGVIGRVARTGVPALVSDVHDDPDYLETVPEIMAELCVPIHDQEQVVGVINIESAAASPLSEADLRSLVMVSQQVDIAIGRARLYAKARESEARFRSAFDHAPIGVALVGLDGRWQHVNRALQAILGFAEHELRGSMATAIIHPDDLDRERAIAPALLLSGARSVQMEMRFRHKDERYMWCLLNVSLVNDIQGAPQILIAQIQDIDERKRLEAERAEILAASQAYAERLSELTRLRADFTAMVAHELGSPLAAVQSWTALLATGTLDEAGGRQALTAIRTELELMQTLLQDMRISAAVERDDFAVRPKPVTVDQLLTSAAMYGERLPGQHPFNIDGSPALSVLADADRISQVLRNLLNNAARYSPPGQPITLRVTSDGPGVRFAVLDHGRGIAGDDVGRIFEKYERGRDAGDCYAPGLGLGLYLSRRIVQAHGSDLTVNSQPGAGSTFEFTLECAE